MHPGMLSEKLNKHRRAGWVLPFLFYIVVAVLAIGANPFKGQTVTPFDLLVSQHAWSPVAPDDSVRQGERSDILDSRLPKWINARRQVRSGEAPLWNADRGGGEEALFNLGYSIFTPAWVIFAATPSEPLGFYLATLFNLAIAGLGMHFFLRRKVGLLACSVGAITFELCGFHAAWLYWPHVMTSMWAPWLLMATEVCMLRPSLRSCLGLSAASAMVIFGGFPFVGMMVFGAGALYALCLAAGELRRGENVFRLIGWYAIGTTLGFLVCGLSLIGFSYWISSYDISYRHGGSILHPRDWRLVFAPWAYEVTKVEKTLYVGTAMAIFGLLAPVCLFFQKKVSPVLIFSSLLLVISGSLVFGVFPEALASHLPGLSNNIWTRAICIFDIALITLGALFVGTVMDVAKSRRWPWMGLIVAAVIVLQVYDVGSFFRKYNGPVPEAFYYPPVPAVTYMKSRLGPFDYVVADRSFLISGTLDAYGIREWFAHKFRSEALKAALGSMSSNAFSSPTSSRLAASDIKTFSPAMAAFNVRFLAVNSDADPYAVRPLASIGQDQSPLAAMPTHEYRQPFLMTDASELDSIAVRLATYGKSGLDGELTLELLGKAGQHLASATVDAASVHDNDAVKFEFPQSHILEAGEYAFTLKYKKSGKVTPITAWSFSNSRGDQPVYVDGQKTDRVMNYFLHVKPESMPFRKVFTQAGISVYENFRAPGGAYYIKSLDEVPDASAASPVSLLSYRSGRFVVRYSGSSAGYVVVPMTMRRDWKIYSNGRKLVPELKSGLMPAVAVNGPCDLTFEYHPRVFKWLGWWLLSLLALLGLMFGMHKYQFKQERRPTSAVS